MASTALVWFRRDLRVHDHPPLTAALDAELERVVPCSCSTTRCSTGVAARRGGVPARDACELRASLRERGGDLVVRARRRRARAAALAHGTARARVVGVRRLAVRDAPRPTRRCARSADVEPRRTHPGNFVADIGKRQAVLRVFPPFWRARGRSCRAARGPWRRRVQCPRCTRLDAGGCRDQGDADPSRTRCRAARPRPASACTPGCATASQLRRASRPRAGGTSRLSPTYTSAASRRAEEKAGRTRRLHAPARGATSTPSCCLHTLDNAAVIAHAPSSTRSSGTATTSTSTPGARAAPAIRSSTPACGSWAHRLDAQPRAADHQS